MRLCSQTVLADVIHFQSLCGHTLHLQRNTRDHLNPNLLESTEVSAVPAVMVGTKTSVEETPVAVQASQAPVQNSVVDNKEFVFF